jgi:hypothetical protein
VIVENISENMLINYKNILLKNKKQGKRMCEKVVARRRK